MSKALPFHTTLQIRDACVCLHVQRAARVLARRFDEALRPFGLTNQQFSLLMALNRPDPPTLGPVAELLGIDRTTLTAALKPLIRAGLARLLRHPDDARARCVRLTARGEARLANALPAWRRLHAAIERELSDPDRLRAELDRLAGARASPDTSPRLKESA